MRKYVKIIPLKVIILILQINLIKNVLKLVNIVMVPEIKKEIIVEIVNQALNF